MKTLKTILQEVISGIKAWASSTFAQDSNTVHKTGNETINGVKTFGSESIFTDTVKKINSNIVKGTNPSSDTLAFVNLWGGTGVSSLTNALFSQRGYVYADGSTSYILYALENVLGGTHTSLSLTYDPNDTIKRYALMRGDFRPFYDNAYNLGIPTHRWNNLYATTTNTDTIQSVSGNLVIHSTGTDKGVAIHNGANTGDGGGLFLYGKTHSNGSLVRLQIYNTTTSSYEAIDLASSSFYPYTNNLINLGTSTKKWKTLNGINPGALSLPDTLGTSGTENVNYFNVIGYLNNTGTIATIPTTATYDGWLYINAKDGAGSYIIIDDSPSAFGTSVYGNNGLGSSSVGLLCLICPIRAGHSYNVRVKSAGIVSARIYPAQGNV